MARERGKPERSAIGTALLVLAALLGAGCTPTTDLNHAPGQPGGRGRVAKTQASAAAVTGDERIVVATNRTDGIVTIMGLNPTADLDQLVLAESRTELAFHPLNASQPWTAVIGTDDDTAYVLLRGTGQVVRISELHRRPRETGRVSVGSEPTSMVISPSGRRIFVANSADGSVSVILTQTLESTPLSLNGRLVKSGSLGPAAVERPGIAHPRALTITDDGDTDDLDETLYATEFFSQPLTSAEDDNPDRSRQGVVYPIDSTGHAPLDAEGHEIPFIALAPVKTGFDDAEGQPTWCFPNQLYAAASAGDRVFVTSVCASPAGPVEAGPSSSGTRAENNFKSLLHSVLYTIDTGQNQRVGEPLVMTRQLADKYTAADADQRMPLIPSEMVALADGGGGAQLYVASLGASAVFPVHYPVQGAPTLGGGAGVFVKMGDTSLLAGLAPLSQNRLLALDDRRRGLAAVDLATFRVEWTSTIEREWAKDPQTDPAELVDEDARRGRRLFATGLGAWSFAGQAWSSCESCHPEGLSDGVTWRFARGPRRTISLAGTYYGQPQQRRLLLWTANIDEVHDVESIARNLSGGVGGVVWDPYALDDPHPNCRLIYDGAALAAVPAETRCAAQKATTNRLNGLNGSLSDKTRKQAGAGCEAEDAAPCDTNASNDWDMIDAFIRRVRAPRAPRELGSNAIARGRALFSQRGCDRCHSGPGWTLSRVFYQPGSVANGAVPSANPRSLEPELAPDAAVEAAWLGTLRTRSFRVPEHAPDAFVATTVLATRDSAPFRSAPADSALGLVDYLYASPPVADQIACALRQVGTFGEPAAPDFEGVFPASAPAVQEVRRVLEMGAYVDKLAMGDTGFNIPSLLGLAAGAPYLPAGNARTLEEVFDPVFIGHHGALGGADLSEEELRDLVDFLLSIDEETPEIATPTDGYAPDLCAQFDAP